VVFRPTFSRSRLAAPFELALASADVDSLSGDRCMAKAPPSRRHVSEPSDLSERRFRGVSEAGPHYGRERCVGQGGVCLFSSVNPAALDTVLHPLRPRSPPLHLDTSAVVHMGRSGGVSCLFAQSFRSLRAPSLWGKARLSTGCPHQVCPPASPEAPRAALFSCARAAEISQGRMRVKRKRRTVCAFVTLTRNR
jgi:hypothetical protein